MTKKIGKTVIIYQEADRLCEFCGQIKETRPYGIDGKDICYECSQKPENRKDVDAALNKLFGD